jgi:predicted nuclease of predicted toxin-antitoxin system
MAQALYMDVHVPSAVTGGLRRRGVDVLTSQEDGTREAHDVVLLERATDLGRILFTQDDDLLAIASQW